MNPFGNGKNWYLFFKPLFSSFDGFKRVRRKGEEINTVVGGCILTVGISTSDISW
jgi:hypothetical protein